IRDSARDGPLRGAGPQPQAVLAHDARVPRHASLGENMRTLFCILAASAALLAQSAKVSGPLPVTAESHPFLAEDHNLQPLALSQVGYVEEEFLISGNANVYDWAADGS